MPVEWVGSASGAPDISGASFRSDGDPPLVRLHLWPNRSLPRRGFVAFIGTTFALVLVPLLAVVGTPILWGLLPFVLGTLGLLWFLLAKSYRDGEILEELQLWSDQAQLSRTQRRGPPLRWAANPYWISVQIYEEGGPVPSYLTLKGGGREVEIGAFLSAEERAALHPVLARLISRAALSAAEAPAAPR
ncbi:MAG: DUF2244 domain-containing protein [Rhodobacteraceae bacterium]|nr:DUF2244 domain-containing protein [Paracoccaceae bacterium]